MDIYFAKEWGQVNKYIENGEPEEFELKTSDGTVRNMFILRKIPILCNGEQYFDITTPYGYGGPYIAECKDGKRNNLLKEYNDGFSQYCEEKKIVSEFVRFHPIVGNGVDFKEIYNARHIRQTVATNLVVSDNPEHTEFSKSCRKNIRRALNAGVTYEIIESPKDIEDFLKVYYSTMDRNHAGDFYYFSREYFQACMELMGENILLVKALFEGKTIAAGFYLTCGKTIHIHLSGTLSGYLYLSPAYVLRYAVTLWGKENGYEMIHHGGGRSNAEDDTLYTFKKQFGKERLDFCVGRKIWNQEIYDLLCQISGSDRDTEYFPAYRSKGMI